MRATVIGLVFAGIGACIMPAAAHHSGVMYEPTRTLTLNGTVKQFSWANPHSWLYVVVTDEGGRPLEWALESNSTANLTRRGWKRDTLKAGDKISVTLRPMKDGTRGGTIENVVTASGQKLP
jgi:hypothetical protein